MKNVKIEVSIKVSENKGIYDAITLGACTLNTESELKPDEIKGQVDSQVAEAMLRAHARLDEAIKAEQKRIEREEQERLERTPRAANY